jgi:hypothetical protein
MTAGSTGLQPGGRLVAQQAVNARPHEPLLPTPHDGLVAPRAAYNRVRAQTVRRQQDDFFIQAIIRRSKGHSDSTIRTGKLLVNLDSRAVTVNDQPLHLTGKEYAIFELLSLRKGTALTKEMILNHLYGGSPKSACSRLRPSVSSEAIRPLTLIAAWQSPNVLVENG